MSQTTSRIRCVTCDEENAISKCSGCLQDFCYSDLGDHRKELERLTKKQSESPKHVSIQQINQWERDSIIKIRQTAEEARQQVSNHTAKYITEIEIKLDKLTDQLQESRKKDNFFETDLNKWKKQLTQLKEELNKPSKITIRHDSTALVTNILVDISLPITTPITGTNAKWTQNGVTVAGGNKEGNEYDQLHRPWSLCVHDDQSVYVADYENHRIVKWKNGATSGQVVAGGNGPGNRNDQLNGPVDVIIDEESDSLIICDYNNKRVVRWPCLDATSGEIIISNIDCWGMAMDNDGYLYVSDRNKHEVRRWKIGDTNGTVVAGGNGQGNRLDQFDNPTYIFVDQDHSVYVSDDQNHRVMKWIEDAKEGVVAAGNHDSRNGPTQLSNPFGLVVDQLDTVYVADFNNHRVMRWLKGAIQGSIVIGRNGRGGQANQLMFPSGLSFDYQNNLYVVDNHNHRIQKFNIDPSSNT